MARQAQGLPTTNIPFFLLAFACKSTRALFIPNENSKIHPEPSKYGVDSPNFKRQFSTSSSSSSSFQSAIFPSDGPFTFFPGSTSIDFFPTTPSSRTFSPGFTSPTSFPFQESTTSPFFSDFSSTSSASASQSISTQAGPSSLPSVSSVVTAIPTDTQTLLATFSGSKSPAIPIIIGTVTGCMIAISIVLCLIFMKKRKRRRLKAVEQQKVEKAFGAEGGFHLLVDVSGSDPTGINPYTALPTSQPVVYPDEKSPVSEGLLSVPSGSATNTQSFAGTSLGSVSSAPVSPVTDYTSPTSALSQQALLEQLNLLRAQIQHVEALAGISTSGPSCQTPSTQDSSEPPPEYDANLGDARAPRTGGKGAALP